jgi:hypothetical protein
VIGLKPAQRQRFSIAACLQGLVISGGFAIDLTLSQIQKHILRFIFNISVNMLAIMIKVKVK